MFVFIGQVKNHLFLYLSILRVNSPTIRVLRLRTRGHRD